MEAWYGLVLSLLLSVDLGLSIHNNDARGLTVGQLYRFNCPVYHLLKYICSIAFTSNMKGLH